MANSNKKDQIQVKNMTDEKISVVIPAYNSSETIGQAVRSVLEQKVPVEVIIVDDCSQDDIKKALKQYKDDERIHILRNESNLGVAKSRNLGVKSASGKYIAFLDADDIWMNGKLEKQLSLMKETGAVLCSTARELITEDGTRTGKVIEVPERITYKKLLRGNVINCSSVLVERDTIINHPMGNDDIHEDYICWLQILRECGYSVAVNEPLILYRQMRNSKSGSKLSSAHKTFAVYRKMGYGFLKSCIYFACYAVNGVIKYFL
ncbi:MAG: glycosyltransferase family 2 protein [Clostridiales bacterium]|nr:glycosyltransferase family 2 protein [Clostridiales bacterium]